MTERFTPRVLEARIDSFRKTAEISGRLSTGEFSQYDRGKCYVIPESHHLYDWIKEEYLPRREEMDDMINKYYRAKHPQQLGFDFGGSYEKPHK